MINFLNLEYFLVAAEELNFTRAARKLYISQQSLSNHISNLEKEFDVILFNRTSPLTLTYAGRALKTRARELLDLRDETYKEISDIKDFSTGQLSIGVSHTRGRVILPEVLPISLLQNNLLSTSPSFRASSFIWRREIPASWPQTCSMETST